MNTSLSSKTSRLVGLGGLFGLLVALTACDTGAPLANLEVNSATGIMATPTPDPSVTQPPTSQPPTTQPPAGTPPPPPPPPPSTTGRQISVSSLAQLSSAISSALPGDVITIAPGTYAVTSKISASRAGTAAERITVRASTLGSVTLQTSTPEPFYVAGPYWTFENLTMEGVCANDTDCEHAFHIVGAAHFTTIRNNVLRDYNAQIKGNGNGSGTYPNDVLVENNVFYDRDGRVTSNPVTKIDVVGGHRWIVRGNTIGDYFKNGGDGISYAAFLKGNGQDGIFENNVVACSKHHSGGVRLGLSFGGGGTSPASLCEGGTCATEHRNGIMRNNVVMNCSDVGIYLNKGQNTLISNNELYQNSGIDVRYATSTAITQGNKISGTIRDREGGSHTSSNDTLNVTTTTSEYLATAPAAIKAKYDRF